MPSATPRVSEMEHDPYCVEERIISDISRVMLKDPQLQEYDILPVKEAKNRSPIVHIQHNMGIEVWCIKMVFMYCREKCLSLEPMWRKEHARLEQYSRTALLLNAHVVTFWNYRKRLIVNNYLSAEKDMLLTKIILSRHPKSADTLVHRRWLLKHSPRPDGWLEEELALCTRLAEKQKCNYHAWSHRQWVINNTDDKKFNVGLWLTEFETSEEWTKFHLSDHSGWHYRQFLLLRLHSHLNQVEDELPRLQQLVDGAAVVDTTSQLYVCLLNEELRKNEDLILVFPGHETLWYYRRFLIQSIESFLPWMEESFIDRCLGTNDPDQQRSLENHRRWLAGCI